jgi:hypothetical protein
MISTTRWSFEWNGQRNKTLVFWAIMQCSFVGGFQQFRGTCCLHHQNQRSSCWVCCTPGVPELIYPDDGGNRFTETSVHFYQATRRHLSETASLTVAALIISEYSVMAMKVVA